MLLISIAGALAVCSQFVSWYGLVDQIRFTQARRDTRGLSFAEAESRFWGKLPWLLFACSLPSIDWTVLTTNAISIALAAPALGQFLLFRSSDAQLIPRRVLFQLLLLFGTLISCTLCREALRANSTAWCVLPVAITVCALSLGSFSQFRENQRRKDTSALSLLRYLTLVFSYAIWFTYGYLKGVTLGWDGAWTICVATGLGLVASSAVLAQFYLYRKPTVERAPQFLVLGNRGSAQSA